MCYYAMTKVLLYKLINVNKIAIDMSMLSIVLTNVYSNIAM